MRFTPTFTIRKPQSALLIAGLCVLSIWQAATDSVTAYELSHGRQVILNRGLQIQSLVYANLGFSGTDRWLSTNATTFNFWCWPNPNAQASLPASQQWSRLYDPDIPAHRYLLPTEMPYLNNFVSMAYDDEVTDLMTPSRQADMYAAYRDWNRLYPNALAYTNNWGTQYTTAQLASYMQATQPDMIMFDHYRPYYASREQWYTTMQQYRTLGLAGNDGTYQTPIPYAQHLTLYRGSYSDPLFSESFVRLQLFASWAFGYTNVNDFVYKDAAGACTQLFSTTSDQFPTVVFNYVAEGNRQSRNLGPALVRLVSSDIRMIRGKVNNVRNPVIPDVTSLVSWTTAQGGDPYMTGITPLGTDKDYPSTTNYSDVWIGHFQSLLASDPGCTFADGLHFMIVNGRGCHVNELYGPGNSAADLAEWYRLDFDFGSSGFDSLVRLSRDTGQVELVTLQYISGELYRLDLQLDGGTGDLFGYWNSSNPLPTVPEPGTLVTLAIAGLIGIMGLKIRRKK